MNQSLYVSRQDGENHWFTRQDVAALLKQSRNYEDEGIVQIKAFTILSEKKKMKKKMIDFL